MQMEPEQQQSINDMYENLGDKIAECLGPALSTGTEFSSPDVIDLIVWNVIISFFVNLAANSTYTVLSRAVSEEKRVDKRTLREASEELHRPVVMSLTGDKRQVCEELIRLSLRHEGIAEKEIMLLTDRLLNIMTEPQ